MLYRLENQQFQGAKPKLIVLQAGINNIYIHKAKDIAAGVGMLVRNLRKSFPEAAILVLGLFPAGYEPHSPLRTKIKKVNQELTLLARYQGVYVKDIGDVFLSPSKTLPRNISYDGIHLTPLGYERFANAILPTLDRLSR